MYPDWDMDGCACVMLIGVMSELLAAFDAFLHEHRRCGWLDGGVEGELVWMACECGARLTHPAHSQRDVGR